ncbi:hypothetical protein PsorP6_008387 [Peronosclerospora sorghi]|uniref:Uncharacterized protein n=1 Tax=Peronosclerospora sorghi TaxID=230839 RepID=A0ACC0W9V1_9STRA|nr:hypothetical protein PsorP6_008387 [Peronosclerospora sorghi]
MKDLVVDNQSFFTFIEGHDSLKRLLFQYQCYISAALVLGGGNITGPHLYTIYPHGSTDKLPFVKMGSGSLAAMSVFEHGYKDDMTVYIRT